jgi:hypothetical protein
MIRLMVIIARGRDSVARDLVSPLASFSFFSVRSGYSDGKTTACVGSVFTAYDVARMADSCISGTSHFSISVLAINHRNTHSHHEPRHRMVIEPHCRPSVGLAIHSFNDV